MSKRMLSLFLCFVLCLSLCPVAALADEVDAQDGYVEVVDAPEVTAEPTPEVTAEPTPEVTAEPTSEVTAEPTPEVTAEPTPETTAEPTPEVTAEPTPEVTAGPTPEVTAEPTSEVTTEPTPEVTESTMDGASEEAVAALQTRIDALPDVEAVAAMDEEQRDAAYMTAQDICDAFDALDEAQQALLNTAKLEALLTWFNEQVETADGEHKHCACGQSSCSYSSHGGVKTFTAWTAANSLPSSAGCYYLTQDVELTTPWRIKADIVLCLNGHKITMTGNSAGNDSTAACILHIFNSYKLTLTDCQAAQGTISRAAERTGLGVYVADGGTFDMYGGTITGQTDTSKTGGGVKIEKGGTFNMYGGSITNNRSENGGGVYNLGVFNMSGGKIGSTVDGTVDELVDGKLAGNRAVNGAGVYNGGTFNMTGGTISNNTSIGDANVNIAYGAGVYNAGTFNMTGGTIKDNVSSQGGGVYNCAGGTFTLSGGNAYIVGNRAYGYGVNGVVRYADGGGVWNKGTFTMNGGNINNNTCGGASYLRGGTVHGHGGGVYNEGSFTMNDGTISGNSMDISIGEDDLNALEVGAFGGGVYVNYGTFNMTGGTISSNVVTSHSNRAAGPGAQHSHGGGVYTNYGTVNMSGGTITGNKAYCGGGVKVNSGGTLNLTTGTISNNSGDEGGGGIYIKGTATLGGEKTEALNVLVSGNTTSTVASSGGGIDNHGTLTVKGGTKISENTSNYGGGIANHGTLTMNSGAIVSGNTANADGGGLYTAEKTGSTPCSATIENVTISDNHANGSEGGGIRNNGTLTLTGVEVKSNTAKNYGGGISNGGTLHVNGGVISGNSANKGGGINDYGTTNLNSGVEIKNNTATVDGGGVYSSNKLNMNAGVTVSGNRATYGAGVYSTKTFNFNGGTISGNTASGNGGGIFVSGTVNMKNDATVSGNSANNGAGLYSNGKGTGNLSGGTIKENTASASGGGVYNGGTANLSGGTIESNTATGNGGGVYNGGTTNLSGGTVKANTATGNGGGVYNAKTFNMTGGTVGGNNNSTTNSATKGGGIYNADTFTLTSGMIVYNTATNGAGVYDAGKNFNMSGSFAWIFNNTASENGGGVYHESGTFNMSGGNISTNWAMEQGGGVYYCQNADGQTHPIKLSGNVTIHGNYRGTARDAKGNLYLYWPTGVGSSRTLDVIVTSLVNGSRIGVGANRTPLDTSQYITISSNAQASSKDFFLSDNAACTVEMEGSKLVLRQPCLHPAVKVMQDLATGDYTCQSCYRKVVAGVTDTSGTAMVYFTDISDALAALKWNGTGILKLMSKPSGTMTLDANKTYQLTYAEGVNLLGSTIKVTAGRVTLSGKQFGNVVESKNGTYSTGEVILDVDKLPTDGMYLQGITTECNGRTIFSMLKSATADKCKLYGFMKRDATNIDRSTWRDHTTTAKQAYAVTLKHLPYTGVDVKTGEPLAAVSETTMTYGDTLHLTAVLTGNSSDISATDVTYCWMIDNSIAVEAKGEKTFDFADKAPGTYTVTCETSYQGYTQQKKITVTVQAAKAVVSEFTVQNKSYDGTTAATVKDLSVTVGTTPLTVDTDYTVTANFADADVGANKNVTVMIELLDSGYVFADGTRTMTVTKTASITQKTVGGLTTDVTRYVSVDGGNSVFIIDALLQAVDVGNYGELDETKTTATLSQTVEGVDENAGNYENTVTVQKGTGEYKALQVKLSLTAPKDATKKVEDNGKLGVLTVTTEAKNYAVTGEGKITVKITLIATSKKVPALSESGDAIILTTRTIEYGTKLSEIPMQDVESQYGLKPENFHWVDTSGTKLADEMQTLSVGTHWVNWSYNPTETGWATIYGAVPITVTKATPKVAGETSVAVEYTGTSVPTSEIVRTVTNENIKTGEATVAGTWSWKGEAPKDVCTNQTYTAVFTPDDTYNYNTAETEVTVTITPKALTITGVTAVDREYQYGNRSVELRGGTLQAATPTEGSGAIATAFALLRGASGPSGVFAGDDVGFTLGMGTMENDAVGNGKSVTTGISLTGKAAGNYTLTQPSDVKVNIKPKDLSDCVIEVEELIYTGEPQTPRVYVEGVQVNPDYIKVEPKTEPGSYKLTIEMKAGKFTFGDKSSLELDWSIAPRPAAELTDAVVAVKYSDHSEHGYPLANTGIPEDAGKLTYELGTLPAGVTVRVDENGWLSYSVTGMTEENAGNMLVVPVYVKSDYYASMSVNLVITVTDKDIPTITAADVAKTYDGKPVAASGTAEFDGQTVAGTWSWKRGGAYDREDDAGVQPIHVQDSGVWRLVFTPDDAVTYAEVEELVNVTIEPKAVTLKSENLQKKYDGKALTNGDKAVTATGMVDGEVFDYEFTGSQTEAGHCDNAFAAKDSTTARVSDYAITYQFGKLLVTRGEDSGKTDDAKKNKDTKPVKTGDEAMPILWAAVLLLALSATAWVVSRRKKRG